MNCVSCSHVLSTQVYKSHRFLLVCNAGYTLRVYILFEGVYSPSYTPAVNTPSSKHRLSIEIIK